MQDALRTQQVDSEGGAGTFILGMICGAAVGAAIGLMYAPKPGNEMRQQLSEQTEWLRRRAAEQADRLRQQASHVYSGASDTINDVVARGREAINVGREAFQRSRPHNGQAGDMEGMP